MCSRCGRCCTRARGVTRSPDARSLRAQPRPNTDSGMCEPCGCVNCVAVWLCVCRSACPCLYLGICVAVWRWQDGGTTWSNATVILPLGNQSKCTANKLASPPPSPRPPQPSALLPRTPLEASGRLVVLPAPTCSIPTHLPHLAHHRRRRQHPLYCCRALLKAPARLARTHTYARTSPATASSSASSTNRPHALSVSGAAGEGHAYTAAPECAQTRKRRAAADSVLWSLPCFCCAGVRVVLGTPSAAGRGGQAVVTSPSTGDEHWVLPFWCVLLSTRSTGAMAAKHFPECCVFLTLSAGRHMHAPWGGGAR